MRLRDFKIEDIEKNDGFVSLNKNAQAALIEAMNYHSDTAYTLEHNGQIIGSAGFVVSWPGVAEGWALFSELIHKYPLSVHKTMVKMLLGVEKKHNIVRMQAMCVKGFDRAEKWLEHLGFKCEGEMEKYGPGGETMLRFARIN